MLVEIIKTSAACFSMTLIGIFLGFQLIKLQNKVSI